VKGQIGNGHLKGPKIGIRERLAQDASKKSNLSSPGAVKIKRNPKGPAVTKTTAKRFAAAASVAGFKPGPGSPKSSERKR